MQNEWLTSVIKKKKNRTNSTNKAEVAANNHVSGSGEGEDWDQPQGEVNTSAPGGRGRERARQRGSGPPRMRGRGSMESRGCKKITNTHTLSMRPLVVIDFNSLGG